MHARIQLVSLAVAIGMITACSDRPTAPTATSPNPGTVSTQRGPSGPAAERAALLTNIPVAGTLADGGSFTGTLTAKSISVDPTTRQLTMTGVVNGTATKATGEIIAVLNQTFTAPVSINRPGSTTSSLIQPTAQASCGILDLVLGPLHLDLLGLVVDLNQVVLDITAVTGAGNLLGNLLCALTGLLDIPGALASITHILDSINTILSGLTVPGIGGAMWIAPATAATLFSA